MKFNRNKNGTKIVEVAQNEDMTIKAIRYDGGSYGVNIYKSNFNSSPWAVNLLEPDNASFYGDKRDVIKALRMVIEELELM